MINQRLYPDVKLGNSKFSIASDGCYLGSIHQGLFLAGYDFSIVELNTIFVEKGVFAPGSALLSAATIAIKVGSIFLEGRNEAWNDAKLISYLKDPSYFVVGEVSGKGIGGAGQHFVKIDKVDVKADGKISMTWIDDPWDGLENQKVTTRYNAYGNILSLRVFKILVNQTDDKDMFPAEAPHLNLNDKDSMKTAVMEWRKSVTGELISVDQYNISIEENKKKFEQKIIEKTDEYNKKLSEQESRLNTEKIDALALQKKTLDSQHENAIRSAVENAVKNARKEWEEQSAEPEVPIESRDYLLYEPMSFIWYALLGAPPKRRKIL